MIATKSMTVTKNILLIALKSMMMMTMTKSMTVIATKSMMITTSLIALKSMMMTMAKSMTVIVTKSMTMMTTIMSSGVNAAVIRRKSPTNTSVIIKATADYKRL
ncbi:hypothetical protein [Aneurinibacillus migulanus]|uniref:Uncharacterized protein n=1 Tax=Aneurinibacillus migulanus TaxID=47500 RepID=A0A1G9CH02_ANEMI|nr:hypothetical protein [Aneurinibacillus migulanus]SDK50943.1 hypothetical protein SAMN04487909_1636 [Aneurinibacillus migulanus]